MKESMSVMMDGELEEPLLEAELAQLMKDNALEEAWEVYHLIGDVLRDGNSYAIDVRSSVASELENESSFFVPKRWFNTIQSWQRWTGGVALAASVLVAVVVSGVMFGAANEQENTQALSEPSYGVNGASDLLDDPYLRAHQEMIVDEEVTQETNKGKH